MERHQIVDQNVQSIPNVELIKHGKLTYFIFKVAQTCELFTNKCPFIPLFSINQRCVDPCPGSCGLNTECTVINHTPSCRCDIHYTGDPFQGCTPVQGKYTFSHFLRERALKSKTLQICEIYRIYRIKTILLFRPHEYMSARVFI